MLHHGSRLRLEGLHTLREDSFRVIRALDQSRAIYITDARDFRRLRVNVVIATGRGDTAASDAMEQLLVFDVDADRDHRQSAGSISKLCIEPGRLIQSSWKTVENKTALRIGLLQSVCDHLVHEVIGDKYALSSECLGSFAELRPLGDVGAKNVTSRDLRDAIGCH